MLVKSFNSLSLLICKVILPHSKIRLINVKVHPAAAAAAKSLQSCQTLCDPRDGSPPGFSRQEHWSGLPFPSPIHESEKWKWSRSVMSDSSDPMDCSPPGSSLYGIFQAKVLEWDVIAFSGKFILIAHISSKNDPQGFTIKDTSRWWKQNQKFNIHSEGWENTFILRANKIIVIEQWI